MPPQTIIQASFNSGEISPLLAGRVDVQKYASSCRALQNFIPLVQGPACKRGGLRYMGEAKYADKPCILIPFRRSAEENYGLEFGDRYIRFWRDRGQVLKNGVPYEIASPYALADIINPDGTKGIQHVQSGDVLYLACRSVPPKKLIKKDTADCAIETFVPTGGPWDEANTNESLKMTASGQRGTVTITANFDAFKPTDVGRKIKLALTTYEGYSPWESDRDYKASELYAGKAVTWDRRIYLYVRRRDESSDRNRSGTRQPTHTEQWFEAWDGDGQFIDNDGRHPAGILWRYDNCGYGIATIKTVVNARTVTVVVQAKYPFPNNLTTSKWTMGLWHGAAPYPCSVTFFRERLTWGGGNRVCMSRAGDFESFEDKDYNEVLPECAITVIVASDQVDNVQWVASGDSLFVGTEGGEFTVSESNSGEPLGPANVKLQPQTSKGSISIQPAKAAGATHFVQRSGKKVHVMVYDFNSDSFVVPDVTVLAEHITRPGIVGIAWEDDRCILWCVRKDGALLGFTYDRQQEVVGWHRHILGGGARAESCAVVDAPGAGSEDLYLVAAIDINGAPRRYLAHLDAGFNIGADKPEDAFFVDFGKTVECLTPVTEVPTLAHLEGRTVNVLVDGATHRDCLVRGGRIVLDEPGRIIQVGLNYVAELETNNIEAGAAQGTAQGAAKKINSVTLRLIDSSGGRVGPDANAMQQLYARDITDPLDHAPGLATGDTEPAFHSRFETAGRVLVRHDTPLPFNLLALIISVDTKR